MIKQGGPLDWEGRTEVLAGTWDRESRLVASVGWRGMVDVTGGMQAGFAGCGLIGQDGGRYSEVLVSCGGRGLQLDGRRAREWGGVSRGVSSSLQQVVF